MRTPALLALLWACAPEHAARAPGHGLHETELVLQSDADGAPTRLFARDGAADAPILLPESAGLSVLAYDLEPRLLGRLDGELGEVPLLGVEPSPDAWRLPRPAAAWTLEGDAFVELGSADALLARFKVPRPPCAPEPVLEPIAELAEADSSGAVAVDDGVLLALQPDRDKDLEARVYLVSTTTVVRLRATGVDPWGPFLRTFTDDRGAWLLWPHREGTWGADLYLLSGRHLARDGLPPRIRTMNAPELPGFFVDVVVSAVVDGHRLTIGRGRSGDEPNTRTHFARLDEAMMTWRPLLPSRPYGACGFSEPVALLELDERGRGRVGQEEAPIRELTMTGTVATLGAEVLREPAVCRSLSARLASGTELIVYERRDAQSIDGFLTTLAARAPGGDWVLTEAPKSDAQAMFALGDRVFVSGVAAYLTEYDVEPARPELPPRYCGEFPVGMRPFYIVPASPDRLLLAGLRGLAAFLDLDP